MLLLVQPWWDGWSGYRLVVQGPAAPGLPWRIARERVQAEASWGALSQGHLNKAGGLVTCVLAWSRSFWVYHVGAALARWLELAWAGGLACTGAALAGWLEHLDLTPCIVL